MPVAMTVIHVNRGSGPGGFLQRARTSRGDVPSHNNFLGEEKGRRRRKEDELVVPASSLPHVAAELLALSPAAPASDGDVRCCHSGGIGALTCGRQLLTAPRLISAHLNTLSCSLHNEQSQGSCAATVTLRNCRAVAFYGE